MAPQAPTYPHPHLNPQRLPRPPSRRHPRLRRLPRPRQQELDPLAGLLLNPRITQMLLDGGKPTAATSKAVKKSILKALTSRPTSGHTQVRLVFTSVFSLKIICTQTELISHDLLLSIVDCFLFMK